MPFTKKVGITIGIKEANESIWTNGIKLNVLIFYDMLKDMGISVDLLNIFPVLRLDSVNMDLKYLNNCYHDYDIIIVMGGEMEIPLINDFKQPGKQLVSYKCGNNLIIDTETIIFQESLETKTYTDKFDEIWYIPQLEESNASYYSTLYRCPSILVPFMWSPKYLQQSLDLVDKDFASGVYTKNSAYVPKKEKVIGILEPNINTYKTCIIPTLIAEKSFRTHGEFIKKLMITNCEKASKHKTFLSMIGSLDMYKAGKIFSESRYQLSFILTQHIDVIISHQYFLPLNYLYLDCVYMGYPLLHNAPLVKDLGYYYPGFDIDTGAAVLNDILENHDTNEEYAKRNKKVLDRYNSSNKKLRSAYLNLLNNIGNNSSKKYNHKLNLFKIL